MSSPEAKKQKSDEESAAANAAAIAAVSRAASEAPEVNASISIHPPAINAVTEGKAKNPVGKRGKGKPKNQAMESAFLAAKALESGRNRLNILASQIHSKCSLYGNVEITLIVSTTLQRCRSQGGGSKKRKLLDEGLSGGDEKQKGGQNHAAGSNFQPSLANPLYLWVYGHSNATGMVQHVEEAKSYLNGATPEGISVTDYVGQSDTQIINHISVETSARTGKAGDVTAAVAVAAVSAAPVNGKGPSKSALRAKVAAEMSASEAAKAVTARPTPAAVPAVAADFAVNPNPESKGIGKRGPGKPKSMPLSSPKLVAKALDSGRNRMLTQAAQLHAKCRNFGNVDITMIISTTLERRRSQGGGSRKTDDLQRTGAGHDLPTFMHIYHNADNAGMLKHMKLATEYARGTEVDGLHVTDYIGYPDAAISNHIEEQLNGRRRERNQNWKPTPKATARVAASLAVTAAPVRESAPVGGSSAGANAAAIASATGRDPAKKCNACQDDIASHYCVDCEDLFCDGCALLHRRLEMARNHTIIPFKMSRPSGVTQPGQAVANTKKPTLDDV